MRLLCGELERELAMGYKDLWEDFVPINSLCAYITLFVLGYSSLDALVRYCVNFPSVSTLSRNIQNASKGNCFNRSMRRMRSKILKRIKKSSDDWVYAFDTTDNPKRLQNLKGRGHWAKSNGSIFDGRNLLVMVAVNTKKGYAVPLYYFPCIKPEEDPTIARTGWELVLDCVDLLVSENFPKLTLVGDSWFDGVPFMKALTDRGFKFVIELKASRNGKVAESSDSTAFHNLALHFEDSEKKQAIFGSTKAPEAIPEGLKGKKYAKSKRLILRAARKKGQPEKKRETILLNVTAVFNTPRSSKAFAYYGSNDLEKPSAWLWNISRCRWNIEVLFRDLKQYLAWGQGSHKTQEFADLSLVMPFLVVVHLRISLGIEDQPISKTLNQANQKEYIRSVKYAVRNPNSAKLDLFLNRMDPLFANDKPRNNVVETIKYKESLYKTVKSQSFIA